MSEDADVLSSVTKETLCFIIGKSKQKDSQTKHTDEAEMAITLLEVLYVLAAIFIPPLPVWMVTGCSGDLLINILLWILGWIPGVIHAFYILIKDGRLGDKKEGQKSEEEKKEEPQTEQKQEDSPPAAEAKKM